MTTCEAEGPGWREFMDSVDGLEEFSQDEIMRALDYLLQEGFVKAVIRNGEPYLIIADEAKNL